MIGVKYTNTDWELWFDHDGRADLLFATMRERYGVSSWHELPEMLNRQLDGLTLQEQLRNQRIRTIELITDEERDQLTEIWKDPPNVRGWWGRLYHAHNAPAFDVLALETLSAFQIALTVGHELGHTFFYELGGRTPARIRGISPIPLIPEEEWACETFAYAWHASLSAQNLVELSRIIGSLRTVHPAWLVPY